ncbi:MAG: type II toxin-antitoxin system Phd/YefM family antitoxin [Streptococcaceae bacterium]|jgi:antitoxin YefM|nr:type II toxin-antitoxin system Phd/YefM family antitoxin [Streptococcaceae bacterium]
MEAVAYSNFRQHLKEYLRQVNMDSEPLIVTNKNPDDNVVVMSKDDYDSWMETMRVQSNTYLMNKIHQGEEEFSQGKGLVKELIELD